MDLSRLQRPAYILFILLPYLVVTYFYFAKSSTTNISFKPSLIRNSNQTKKIDNTVKPADTERVLVIYVWADSDVESLGNLRFFVRNAVHASHPVDYYFILQQIDKKPVDESRLPTLPPNAHYIQHENQCWDIGTIGWFLSLNTTNTTLYKYFIFMNASVRGPFFPTYFDNNTIWWFTLFTKKLNDEIKLVGPSINCEQRPHVQSYLMVTDQVGFRLLNSPQSGVFRCHGSQRDAVFEGEIAASQFLLHANYQIASLQSKYQGWDFRNGQNSGCNYGASPIFHDNAIDGISHDPFELIFVKYKGVPPFDTALERRATVYQKWLDERPRTNANMSTNKS